jgi:glycerol-3-phosphate acyltransferase PlsY
MGLIILALIIAYLIGSIPNGLLVVWIFSGKDVRTIESGRTGGTNAMRAAGITAGLITTVLDILKGAGVVWLARWIVPGNIWVEVAAAVLAVIGHNYSIYLIERNDKGNLRMRGGAGGTCALGAAIGLWPLAGLFVAPLAIAAFVLIGYASAATMTIGLASLIVFAVRAVVGTGPWEYIVYGLMAVFLIVWALRPNLKRIANGTERAVGLRAARQKKVTN